MKLNGKDVLVFLKGNKGDTGAKIVSTVLVGQDENGGNIYEQTFDNGTKARFVAPKGEKGEKGEKGDAGEGGVTEDKVNELINEAIGDVDAVLDDINGEVV